MATCRVVLLLGTRDAYRSQDGGKGTLEAPFRAYCLHKQDSGRGGPLNERGSLSEGRLPRAFGGCMLNNGLFTSITDDWHTPKSLFDALNFEFVFEIDLCADRESALCDRFYSKEDDSLKQKWAGRCWCNPPYGREIGSWVEKAYLSTRQGGAVVVMLIPSRTDTDWWHRFVMRASEIRFIKGRIRFSGHKSNAPFPSAIVVFGKE